ncbi:MAG TPA: hypothetical protein VMY69_01500 [Phycisphaerae bacterium]|nr:hypothetical protein [Phycisphaerae bacterium]
MRSLHNIIRGVGCTFPWAGLPLAAAMLVLMAAVLARKRRTP